MPPTGYLICDVFPRFCQVVLSLKSSGEQKRGKTRVQVVTVAVCRRLFPLNE